jgi:hypothetical protein
MTSQTSTRKPSWELVQSLIGTVRKYSDAHKEKLVSVVIESNQGLKPLCDPLQARAGLNRWLSRAREEAYSDWLAWIIEQLKPDQILTLFGISDSSFAESCKGVPKCSREIVIPNGRLDILIEFGSHARIVIEVKKTAEQDAYIDKQKGYTEWIDQWKLNSGGKCVSLLLVTDASETYCDAFPDNFRAVKWYELCIGLRKLLLSRPFHEEQLGEVRAAMFIAVIGAVEENLLGLSLPTDDGYFASLKYGRTAQHIERSLGSKTMGDTMKGSSDVQANTELLTDGVNLYPIANIAIDELRKSILKMCHDALLAQAVLIHSTLAIDPSVRKEFENTGKDWASLGLRLDDIEKRWFYNFYLWWEGRNLYATASVVPKNRDTIAKIFGKLKQNDWNPNLTIDRHNTEVWICQLIIDPAHVQERMQAIIVEWCTAWQRLELRKYLGD